MLHPAPFMDVFDLELHELLAPQRVIEERREDRAIALAFERRRIGCPKQRARLVIA
jgi:hypothetical protein